MAELKPCKCYCKSFEMIDLPSGKKMVRCSNCWRTSAVCDTEQQAIDAWNKRS